MKKTTECIETLHVLGIALIRLPIKKLKLSRLDFDLIYKLGIDDSMIQDILEIFRDDLISKESGNSIIPLEQFSVYINFFVDDYLNKIILIYLLEKNAQYLLFYKHSRYLITQFNNRHSLEQITKFIIDTVKIPKAKNISGIFIVSVSGCPLLTKINERRSDIIQSDVQISGFLTALHLFSEEVITKDSVAKLKEINFGNQMIFTIMKHDIIFAFLVSNKTFLMERYMYLIADEFIKKYKEDLIGFDGDVARFKSFNDLIEKYFDV
ncbi:MAG: hypothetical protein ACFFAO_18105 [Candidatus Hermodarchaeota archaeon]